jgi:hypothetical protein
MKQGTSLISAVLLASRPAFAESELSRVPSMFDSLGVQVPYTT